MTNKYTIEAHGVKGMKSTPWRKTFKSIEALNAWVEKTGAEIYAIREIAADEMTFR
jgi:type II secretory pathway component PulM